MRTYLKYLLALFILGTAPRAAQAAQPDDYQHISNALVDLDAARDAAAASGPRYGEAHRHIVIAITAIEKQLTKADLKSDQMRAKAKAKKCEMKGVPDSNVRHCIDNLLSDAEMQILEGEKKAKARLWKTEDNAALHEIEAARGKLPN